VIRGIVEGSKGTTREIAVVLSKEGKVLSRTEVEALRKCGAPAGNAARIAGGPFKGFPEWGRGAVSWGTGAKEAAARAAEITAQEARALDPAKVRAAKEFYEGIYRESLKGNPNAAAKARTELMDRILELQGGK
jgi:hypothetical protein